MKKILILITIIFLTSCSTIVNGDKHKFKIYSNTNKEIIILDKNNNIISKSNSLLEIYLPKKYSFLESANYTIKTKDETVKIDNKINKTAFVLGNILFPLGYIIDASTGSMYNLVIDGNIIDTIELK